MSACLSRNYNFWCINFFLACFCASQRTQRRKAELTLAQIRQKLPNSWANWHQIWHTCANLYGNGCQTNCPSRHKGMHVGGFRGSTIQKSGKVSDWHQLWFTFADSSGNGHRLIQVAPQYPKGHLGGGGLGCHKFKNLWKLSNGWTDWHQIWHTSADPSGNGYTPNKLPLETQGALGGFRGQTFKSLGKLSNGWTDWHQL